MDIVHAHLTIFVATRREDVPAGCERYLSVDGTVPGNTLRWDHHVTGHAINLDAMPERLDARSYDGVGTTLADADDDRIAMLYIEGNPVQLVYTPGRGGPEGAG